MNSTNPLDPIWQAYQVTRDCLKIAQKMVKKENYELLNRTQFINASQEKAIGWITRSHDESDDFVILSLWAKFERFIIDYIQAKGRKILEESPVLFSQRFYERLEKEVEYWKIDDILVSSSNSLVQGKT
ncbi:MAG: hypothetical protein QME81_05795 [bacterium]|nr:hypothetical protein [bacterium]